jgi:hypothetical protein
MHILEQNFWIIRRIIKDRYLLIPMEERFIIGVNKKLIKPKKKNKNGLQK